MAFRVDSLSKKEPLLIVYLNVFIYYFLLLLIAGGVEHHLPFPVSSLISSDCLISHHPIGIGSFIGGVSRSGPFHVAVSVYLSRVGGS